MVENDSPNVAIIMFPWASKAPYIFVSDIIRIIEPIANNIHLITGNKERIKNKNVKIQDVKLGVHYAQTKSPLWFSYLLWILKFFIIQVLLSLYLIKIIRNFDIIICMSYPFNLFSLIIAKIFGKKVLISVIGSPSLSYRKDHKGEFFSIRSTFSAFLHIFEKANFIIADGIIVETEGVVNFLNLDKYRNKIYNMGARYINLENFKIKKNINERDNLIGYIGRLEDGKGVMNFFNAIPLVIDKRDDVKFFIAGNGPLFKRLENKIKENSNLNRKVELIDWIAHENVTNYLNELKIYVLPSYSEGLPTGVLEAMACGTTVLATPVGGITDVIIDEKTGFIIKKNSSKTISEDLLKILEYSNLEKIVNNADEVIKQKFTYDDAVKRWKKIIYDVNS